MVNMVSPLARLGFRSPAKAEGAMVDGIATTQKTSRPITPRITRPIANFLTSSPPKMISRTLISPPVMGKHDNPRRARGGPGVSGVKNLPAGLLLLQAIGAVAGGAIGSDLGETGLEAVSVGGGKRGLGIGAKTGCLGLEAGGIGPDFRIGGVLGAFVRAGREKARQLGGCVDINLQHRLGLGGIER